MKIPIGLILCILLIPSVFADVIIDTSGNITALLLAFVGNYIINFILIFIQSKIWLDLDIKKILLGLLMLTPVVMIIEGLIAGSGDLGINLFIKSLSVIFISYFFLGKFYWKLENKETIITAIIMGIITNPFWFFKIIF